MKVCYIYLDIQLKLKDETAVVLTPAYFQGSLESSLTDLFGEIGGQTELELLEFDVKQKRAIIRIPKFVTKANDYYTYKHIEKLDMSSYSYCKTYGKDKVIFVTKEDHSKPSTIELPPPEPAPGLITKEGEINWSCPCLGGMATGPCGVEFRDAFSCFHRSVAEPQGSDCLETFRNMQECFIKYPTVYNKTDPVDDDEDNNTITSSAPIKTIKEEEKTIETLPLTESQALEKK